MYMLGRSMCPLEVGQWTSETELEIVRRTFLGDKLGSGRPQQRLFQHASRYTDMLLSGLIVKGRYGAHAGIPV